MRKLKFIMPFGVVAMAVGLAFASSGKTDNMAKRYIQTPEQCVEVETICNNMGTTCYYQPGQKVFALGENLTRCSEELKHQP